MTTVLSIPGESVRSSALRAANTAFLSGQPVTFERYHTTCVIQPTDSVEVAEERYYAALLAGNHAATVSAGLDQVRALQGSPDPRDEHALSERRSSFFDRCRAS